MTFFDLRRRLFLVLFCLVAPLIAQETKTSDANAASPLVDVYRIFKPQEEAITLIYPAKTISAQSVTLKARANGLLLKKFFNEGDFVKEGDVLYKIESDTYEAALNQAKANVANANVQEHKTRKDWERIQTLFETGASSEQEKDAAYFAFESAKAALKNAEASLQNAMIALDRTTIKAPIGGMTGLKLIDVGSLVTEGTPLIDITQIAPLHVEFSIPDSDVMRQKYAIKNGSWAKPADGKIKASLMVGEHPLKEIGTVDFFDSSLNAKTGSLKARATFKNEHKELLPNQFVKISLIGLVRTNVIKVPQKAVLQTPLGASVFVVQNGKASTRAITVAENSGNDAIVESGLQEGDLVVVNNFFRIKNDMPVKIERVINEAAR